MNKLDTISCNRTWSLPEASACDAARWRHRPNGPSAGRGNLASCRVITVLHYTYKYIYIYIYIYIYTYVCEHKFMHVYILIYMLSLFTCIYICVLYIYRYIYRYTYTNTYQIQLRSYIADMYSYCNITAAHSLGFDSPLGVAVAQQCVEAAPCQGLAATLYNCITIYIVIYEYQYTCIHTYIYIIYYMCTYAHIYVYAYINICISIRVQYTYSLHVHIDLHLAIR